MEGIGKATSAGRSPDDPPIAGQLMVAVGTLGDGKALLSLAGEFDLSNVETAESGLADALAKSDEVVIDLSGLTYIDSTAIAFLVGAGKTLGPRLAVRESNHPSVTRLLEIVGLRSYFRQPEVTDAWLTSRR
jgi:anti-anti-sigma factor